MMFHKQYLVFLSLVILGIIIMIFELWLTGCNNKLGFKDIKVPVILWWTPFTGDKGHLGTCGQFQCYFTENRTFVTHSLLKGILFYGSSFRINDLPIPKFRNINWGLIHEESPRNNPIFVHEEALNLFNYSATFSRYSDIPLILVDLPSEEELVGTKYFVPVKEKTRLMTTKKLAPLLYIQSDCNTASDRDSYILELMKYIQVDSYGLCLNNRQFSKRLKDNYLEILNNEEFLSFVAEYKFTLAFENAVCNDYITEKLWRPLIVGSVPIYYGSPSFKDWLPNNKSAISVLDFSQPMELARFLLHLINDDLHYQQYLQHKLSNSNDRILNSHLLSALRSKVKKRLNDFQNYVKAFECFVCEKLHDKNEKSGTSIVTRNHYYCPLPMSPLSSKIDRNNWWVGQWFLEKCTAILLAQYMLNNTDINMNRFNEQKLQMYDRGNC